MQHTESLPIASLSMAKKTKQATQVSDLLYVVDIQFAPLTQCKYMYTKNPSKLLPLSLR